MNIVTYYMIRSYYICSFLLPTLQELIYDQLPSTLFFLNEGPVYLNLLNMFGFLLL